MSKLEECANCLGSGQVGMPFFGKTKNLLPIDCKYCEGTGEVPEIHNEAFVNEHLFDSHRGVYP